MRELPQWGQDILALLPDIQQYVEDRHAWTRDENVRFMAAVPLPEEYHVALWRARHYSAAAISAWPTNNDFTNLQLLSIVDAHDAIVDASAGLMSGGGPPSVALLRRAYECALLLTALDADPAGTRRELERALQNPRQHDNHARAAAAGLLGAVMPHARRLRRHAGLAHIAELNDVETGLADVGHGGPMAIAFYLGSDDPTVDPTIRFAEAFFDICNHVAQMTALASFRIVERLGIAVRDEEPEVFDFTTVERREDEAMDQFEAMFPSARHAIWASLMGMRSITLEISERLGRRPYDDLRRQHIVLVEGATSAELAFEMLHRGRLSAAATAIRRLFELAHEAQLWAEQPQQLGTRAGTVQGNPGELYKTPAVTRLIDQLCDDEIARLQRRTYSTLCSVAHGGLQAHLDLLSSDMRIVPAPRFDREEHRWLLGTFSSALAQLQQSAFLIARRVDPDVEQGHLGYGALFEGWLRDMPTLGLVDQDRQ